MEKKLRLKTTQFGALRGYQVAALEAAAQIAYDLDSTQGVRKSMKYLEEGLGVVRQSVDSSTSQQLSQWATSAWYTFGATLYRDGYYEVKLLCPLSRT